MVSCRRLAPITATDRALKNLSIEADSAWCSRLAITPMAVSVGVDGEVEDHHAVLVLAGEPVADVTEGLDHPVVVGEHLGDEALDAPLAAGLGEVLEQQLRDATPLVLVLDEERDLRLAGPDHVVAAHGDHLPGQQHDERDPVDVVDLGEALHVAVGQRRHRAEEAVVLRLVGHPGVELDQQPGVGGRDRPDVRRTPVTQEDVGLPVARGCRQVLVEAGHRAQI